VENPRDFGTAPRSRMARGAQRGGRGSRPCGGRGEPSRSNPDAESSLNSASSIRRVGVAPISRAFLIRSSSEASGQHLIQPPDSRGPRPRLATRRAGWIWLCILHVAQGYADAERRESGRARARRTSPGNGAPPAHYHTEPSTREWLRAILRGGMSHELDRLLGRRGRHRCLRAENDRRLLGVGRSRGSPIPKRGRSESGRGGDDGRSRRSNSRRGTGAAQAPGFS